MIKLTKTELRLQEQRLAQLEKYLPTLQLKKMLLQLEINLAEQEIECLSHEFDQMKKKIYQYVALFSEQTAFDLFFSVKVDSIERQSENIAGIDIPILKNVIFEKHEYFLFDTPVWLDFAIQDLKTLIFVREKIVVAREKKELLIKEFREVSIRVNLFEKVLIPRSEHNIRKIKIFLGDQRLASVCQAKVAKKKIFDKEDVGTIYDYRRC